MFADPLGTLGIIVLIFGATGLGGLFLGIYNAVIGARKGTIEEWRGLLEEQRNLIVELKKKLDEKEEENEDLKDWADRLVHQVRGAGLEPVPFRHIRVNVNHPQD